MLLALLIPLASGAAGIMPIVGTKEKPAGEGWATIISMVASAA
jgi:hypothetical protein